MKAGAPRAPAPPAKPVGPHPSRRRAFAVRQSHHARAFSSLSVRLVRVVTLILVVLLAAPAGEARPDSYALDEVSRAAAPTGRLACPKVPLARYGGDVVRYQSPVLVFEGFVPRLRRFEEVVRDVAREVYGRAPRRILHVGTYNCRRIGGYPELLSEHALANGIDVRGFEFGPARRGDQVPTGLPRGLLRGFSVGVREHWEGEGPKGEVHRRFLHRLAAALVARPEIFRTLLGPGYPGHDDHFHFDCAPYRVVHFDNL